MFWIIAFLAPDGYSANISQVLSDQRVLEIYSSTKAVYTVRKRILIAGEKDKSLGKVAINENDLQSIKSVKGEIRDLSGKRLKKLHKKDLREFEYSPGYVLYSGNKYTVFNLTNPTLPYILVYEYTIELHSLFNWPAWFPQEDVPVGQASFELRLPGQFQYNYRTIGNVPNADTLDGGRTLQWSLKDIPPYPHEYRTPPDEAEQFGLIFTPAVFKLYGDTGSLRSWNTFGRWATALFNDQIRLDPTAASDLNVEDGTDSYTKIQRIYEYVQQKTRYVAISLGEHSWKPHSAQQVCDKKYGDCKDLSGFFIALLQRYNIPAFPALIRTSNYGEIHLEFPTNRFNHVITFIPLDNDTLWVDCTSEVATITDLPWSIEGCYALILRGNHSVLIRTPISQPDENVDRLEATATLLPTGSLEIEGEISATGNEEQQLRGILLPLTADKRRNTLLAWLSDYAPDFKLQRLQIRGLNDLDSSVTVSFRGIASRYGNTTQRRIIVNPSFYRRWNFKGEDPDERVSSVYYSSRYKTIEQITYTFCPNPTRSRRCRIQRCSYRRLVVTHRYSIKMETTLNSPENFP